MSLTLVMIIIVCKWGGEAQELGISLFQNMWHLPVRWGELVSVSVANYVTSNGRMIDEWRTGNNRKQMVVAQSRYYPSTYLEAWGIAEIQIECLLSIGQAWW
jgi:hypothetical protein